MKFNEFQENPYHPWAIRDPVAPSCNTTNNTSHYDNIKPNASIHNITSLMNQFTGNTVTSAPLSQPLLATSEIALPFRAIFPFAYFNAVQSLCLDKIYYSDKSTVVCSPTGSGKTVLLELAILRLLQSFQLSGASNYNLMKVLYIAPIKALCSEKANDWHAKFSKFGITVGELTGDSAVNEQAFLMKTHIIVSTPEKWDSVTRHWFSNREYLEKISLVLIDEVHLLTEKRGATLESIVSRMKTRNTLSSKVSSCRFITTSATMPNWHDIASWLGAPFGPAEALVFGEEYRPVPLQKFVYGYIHNQEKGGEFKFDNSLNYKLQEILNNHAEGRPTLVFCSTRKAAMQAAEFLARNMPKLTHSFHGKVKDRKLAELLSFGLAFHHAGLAFEDRLFVERSFIESKIQVLFSTSTLSVGVNLPAHLVIIKSTMRYVDRHFEEYSELDILQMMGRAGRPQFDINGTVAIMTDSRNVAKYESLINGRHPIESKLAENIIEYLNVEFSLGTVKDLNTARTWLKSTFFYIRASSNPMQYFPGSSILDVDTSIDDLLVNAVGKLREAGMIHKVDKDELYSSSLYGKAMSKYYIRFGTMCQFLDLLESYRSKDLAIDSCSVTRAIITCFGNADEFMELRYQPGEKKFLNDLVAPKSLNAAKIKYPFLTPTQGKLKETWQKVYLLVQVHLGDIAVSDRQQSATWNAMLMNQEINFIVTQGNRILRCFLDCFSKMAEEPSGLSTGLVFLFEALVRFSCALFGGSWSDSHHVLRQVDKLGKAYTNALTDAGVTTFKELSHLDPRKLEFILGRNPPFGNTVLSALAKFPLFYIRVNQMVLRDENSALKREMYVTVGLFNPEQVSLKNQSGSLTAHLFICAVQGKSCRLLLYGRPSMSELKFNKDIKLTLPSDPDANFDIIVSVIPDYVSGLEVQERFECEVIQKDSHQVDIIAEKLTEPIPRDSVNRIQITGDSIEHIEHVNFNAPIHNAIKKKKTKCKHRCFNRLLCRHNCCKEAPNQHQITDGNSNFLAKAPEKITEFPNIIDNLNLKQDITEQIFEDSFDMPSLHENVTLESSTGYVLASDDSSLIQRQKSVSSNFSSPATHKRIRPNILTPLLERAYRFDSPLSNTPETPINCNRSGLSTNINMNHHSTLPMNINTKHCCNLSANNHSRLPICSKHPDSFSSFPSPEGSFQSVPAGDINHFSSVSDKQYTKSQSFSSGTRKSSDFRSYLEQFKARYNNSSNLRGEVHVETLSQKKSIAAFNAEAIVGNKVLLSKWTT